MTIDRRRALIVLGSVAPCVFGCVAAQVDDPVDDIHDPHDPDDRDAGDEGGTDNPSSTPSDNPSDNPSDSPGSDAGGTTSGTGASPDAGGTAPSKDAGGTSTGGSTGGTPPSCPTTLVDAGSVSSFAPSTWHKVTATKPFIIGHDAGGIYAFSAKCTHHSSVTIGAPNASGVSTCPSHGAQFDGNGTVIRGPATSSLVHYAVTLCGGRVYVNTGSTVSSSTRAKP